MAGTLELDDMQGLLMYGYGRHLVASYLLVHVDDAAACRGWMNETLSQLTNSNAGKEREVSVNLAFSHSGLKLLAGDRVFEGFSREFVEGMVTPHRQRILGDLSGSPNDPDHWDWGGPSTQPVHLLVMLFADEPTLLRPLEEGVRRQIEGNGMTVLHALRSDPLANSREHFGFMDGITNPEVQIDQSSADGPNHVRAGEFVLGYPNEAGVLPFAPALAGSDGWGRNGSYLVFRQIEQDVEVFWSSVRARADDLSGPAADLGPVGLASKMVGRWPNGVPLTLAPDDPEATDQLDDFGFASHDDAAGFKCPLGSHIRRSNPRDALGDGRHKDRRVLRRGRSYGAAYSGPVVPPEATTGSVFPESAQTDDGRGLLFLCLNANLGTQFEFVQQTWLNSPKFNHATDSIDPIAGVPARLDETSTFCIPQRPVHLRIPDWKPPLRVRGGAYFFIPSLSSIKQLADSISQEGS